MHVSVTSIGSNDSSRLPIPQHFSLLDVTQTIQTHANINVTSLLRLIDLTGYDTFVRGYLLSLHYYW